MIRMPHLLAAGLAGGLTLSAVAQDADAPAAEQPATPFNQEDAAYALGYGFGQDIARQDFEINTESFVEGLRASLEGNEPRLSEQKMQEVMEQFQQAMLQQQVREMREQAKQAGEAGQVQRQQMIEQQVRQMEQVLERRQQAPANLSQAQQFLEQNKQEPDVQVTDSGLQYKVIEEGEGASPSASDTVKVHYRGTLLDGTEFDSSYARGEPATFRVDQVVAGWTEALQKMKVGGKWKLWIPPDLGYGAQGRGPVPPSALMVFEVELLEIVGNQ